MHYPCCLFRSLFGLKNDQKIHTRNQNQIQRSATRFLAGETVGFCFNAPAGPASRTSWGRCPRSPALDAKLLCICCPLGRAARMSHHTSRAYRYPTLAVGVVLV